MAPRCWCRSFIVYFFIGTVLNLDRFTAGVAALAVFTGALRGGNRARRHQLHSQGADGSGQSLGMTSAQTMRYVILPSGLQTGAATARGSVHQPHQGLSGLRHLHHGSHQGGREVVSSTFSPFEVWFTVALLYLVLTGTSLPFWCRLR